MERNEWNSRWGYDSDRNRAHGHRRQVDEDSYRGAYRLDTTSDHRHETTWDGFDRRSDSSRRGTDYNLDYNRNYNNDYNRNYNSDQRRVHSGEDNYSRDNRSGYRGGDDRIREEQFRPTSGGYNVRFGGRSERLEHSSPGAGNFDADYRPDHYGNGGGANYGNMAGSLSYGYDGDYNANPDWDSQYDPLTGHHRSYHGHYESRHPERD